MEKNYNLQDVIDFLKKEDLLGMQCFCVKNIAGDRMKNIYEKDGITIDLCTNLPKEHSYLEIFGLTNSDFNVIEDFFVETLDLGSLVKLMTLADREARDGNN